MLRFIGVCLAGGAFGLAAAGCGGHSTSTDQPAAGVVATARAGAMALGSSVVEATGNVVQRGQTVRFRLRFTSEEPGRLAYDDESTLAGATSRVSLVVVPPRAWSLEHGVWTPFTVVDTRAFLADSVWSLAPLGGTTFVAEEHVGAAIAHHYHASVDVEMALSTIAGLLTASDETSFSGTINHFDADFWVDDERGLPVKATWRGTGDGTLELAVELISANDPAVTITPPAP